ncbi:binuclear zinc transcription factor [Dactylonectria macrodidyma]|uniref:Binuclear zinc transcription factor n=1 Tax=Dactylonectria macrodidyma TaxID=307937 RepID=A0A9P9EPS0_9HYPO|nr:binuclear zinc transcription factor [Dactylonectria macrodidyma]
MSEQSTPSTSTPASSTHDPGSGLPSISVLSCYQCRESKKKCNRIKPSCRRCIQAGNDCTYPESRQVSVGKRKRVHELEAKIEHLARRTKTPAVEYHQRDGHSDDAQILANLGQIGLSPISTPADTEHSAHALHDSACLDELTRLHLFEQLPSHDLILDLTNIYFNTLHHGAPMLHQQRFVASLHLPIHLRPPMCLQYAIMASAATVSESHRYLAMPFYQRARTYANSDEMGGLEDVSVTLADAQCWSLLAYFEAEHVMFSRASLSLCRSVRIAQMLNLHKLDKVNGISMALVQEPKDWTDVEEQRRTWWVIFCADRLVSATTKWPTLIQEHQVCHPSTLSSSIQTLLPASDEAYSSGREETTCMLADESASERYTPFTARVRVSHLFYLVMDHTSQIDLVPNLDPNIDPFWKRHRALDNDLAVVMLLLPESLRLPANYHSQHAVFIHILIHTATVCLHRAALYRVKLHNLPDHLKIQSQHRLLPAAENILNVFRITSDLRITLLNPLINFSAYIAALVFLEDVLSDYSSHGEDNLEFLLKIMIAIGRENAVTRSLAGQLAKEMADHGIRSATIEKIKELEPCPEIVPLLAALGPNSTNVIFCFK